MSNVATDVRPLVRNIVALRCRSVAGVINVCALGYLRPYGRGVKFAGKQGSISLQ